MKNKKRERCVFWFGVLATLLFAGPASAGLKVFACHEEWAILAEELAGESAAIFTPETTAENSRKIQLSGSIDSALRSADVVLCSSKFKWLSQAIEKSGNPNIQVGASGLILADELVKLNVIEDGHSSHTHYNRYVHADPKRLRAIAGQTTARLIQIDAASADLYKANAKRFIGDLGALIAEVEKDVTGLKGKPVVGDVYSAYLLDWLGLQVTTSIEIAAGREALGVVHTSMGDPSAHVAFASQRDLPIVVIPFGPDRSGPAKSYIDYFRAAASSLIGAL